MKWRKEMEEYRSSLLSIKNNHEVNNENKNIISLLFKSYFFKINQSFYYFFINFMIFRINQNL